MLHVTSVRITNGKLTKRKFKNKFLRNTDELIQLETKIKDDFLKVKYPEGIPFQDPDSKQEFITVDLTHVTIPDREFLYYLVKDLNFKTIPNKIIELV